jgi:hypothetical protein
MNELPTQRTARKIIKEKAQRPAAPETHAVPFGDKPEDLGHEDAEPPTKPNLCAHPGAAADEAVPHAGAAGINYDTFQRIANAAKAARTAAPGTADLTAVR